MATIRELCTYLEEVAPLHLQEPYDNAGLIVGNPEVQITNALICLDSTEAVVDEAIELGCNIIIAHHPIVFSGLKKFTGRTYIERTIIKAIKHDIAIYAIHTNLDNVYQNGVNGKIASKIGLTNTCILAPKDETRDVGSGMVGLLSEEMNLTQFLVHLKEKMQLNTIKYTNQSHEKVRKIAVCGGSGSFLLEQAIQTGADVFITADYKYHQFFDANNQIVIVDIGHYESEFFTIELLQELINEKFITFAPRCTEVNTNPINYL